MTLVVGLDLSLTSTGVARVTVAEHESGPPAVTLHRLQSSSPKRHRDDPPPTLVQQSLRLRKMAGDIYDLAAPADLVLIEGPAFGSHSAGTWDRAGLWWLVVARLTGTGRRVVVVNPSHLKQYALGKGSGKDTDKDHVLAAVVRRYHWVEVDGNDAADALVMAAMGARFVGFPIEPEGTLPSTHQRAMKGPRWA